ncbi:MAG: hypothetical protein AAFQ82_10555 [Myxococcota bacterium]
MGRGQLLTSCVLAAALGFPAIASAVEVTASGDAALGADPNAAFEQARNRALVAAVERVVGITIESEFTQRARERIQGERSKFDAELRDVLNKRSEGFVESYQVVKRETVERMGQPLVRVTVKAEVFESKVEAQLRRFADLLAAADNPTVMVVVQEVIRDLDGQERVNDTGQLGAYLEAAFKDEGFELLGANQAKALSESTVDEFQSFHLDVASALDLARSQGADLLVAGRVVLHDRGPLGESAALPALANRVKVEVEANVRVLLSATGEVLSPASVQHMELGSDFPRAVHRVYRGSRGKGFNVVEKVMGRFLPDVKRKLEEIAKDGRSWMVELSGIRNFRTQGRPFLRLVAELPGVSKTRQTAFAKGRLEIEVRCVCTVDELQDRLFDASRSVGALQAMDLAGSSSGRLNFSL